MKYIDVHSDGRIVSEVIMALVLMIGMVPFYILMGLLSKRNTQ
jgi:hypothetical protein